MRVGPAARKRPASVAATSRRPRAPRHARWRHRHRAPLNLALASARRRRSCRAARRCVRRDDRADAEAPARLISRRPARWFPSNMACALRFSRRRAAAGVGATAPFHSVLTALAVRRGGHRRCHGGAVGERALPFFSFALPVLAFAGQSLGRGSSPCGDRRLRPPLPDWGAGTPDCRLPQPVVTAATTKTATASN